MFSEPGYIPKGFVYRKTRMPALYKKTMDYLDFKILSSTQSTDNSIIEEKKENVDSEEK